MGVDRGSSQPQGSAPTLTGSADRTAGLAGPVLSTYLTASVPQGIKVAYPMRGFQHEGLTGAGHPRQGRCPPRFSGIGVFYTSPEPAPLAFPCTSVALFSSSFSSASSSSNCSTIVGGAECAGHRRFTSAICCSSSLIRSLLSGYLLHPASQLPTAARDCAETGRQRICRIRGGSASP